MYIVNRHDSVYSVAYLGTFETAEEALAFLEARKVQYIEEDPDVPGCYDGYGSDGRIYSIEAQKNFISLVDIAN